MVTAYGREDVLHRAHLQGIDTSAGSQLSGGNADRVSGGGGNSKYRGAQGLDPELIERIEKQFGFDKPAPERYVMMIKNYLTFDLGESYYKSERVTALIIDKLPVSISIGLWSTLIIYLISIPLGIRKAVRDGSRFDVWTSGVIIVGYATFTITMHVPWIGAMIGFAVFGILAEAADVGGGQRDAGGSGLQRHDAERFVVARQHRCVGAVQQLQ